jgi:hypothetical protein
MGLRGDLLCQTRMNNQVAPPTKLTTFPHSLRRKLEGRIRTLTGTRHAFKPVSGPALVIGHRYESKLNCKPWPHTNLTSMSCAQPAMSYVFLAWPGFGNLDHFFLLASVNPTVDWGRLPQRFPVLIQVHSSARTLRICQTAPVKISHGARTENTIMS